MLHACLAASLPAPIGYYRAMVRPLAAASMIKKLAGMLSTPLLQLHAGRVVDEQIVARPTGAIADDVCGIELNSSAQGTRRYLDGGAH